MLLETDVVATEFDVADAVAGLGSGRRVWLRGVEALHGCQRAVLPLMADALVWMIAAAGAGVSALPVFLVGVSWLTVGTVFGLYRRRTVLETYGLRWYLKSAWFPFAVMLAGAELVGLSSRPRALGSAAAAMAALVTIRAVTWTIVSVARRGGAGLHPTLVVGGGHETDEVTERLACTPERGLVPIAALNTSVVDDSDVKWAFRLLDAGKVEHIVIAPTAPSALVADLMARAPRATGMALAVPHSSFVRPGLVCDFGTFGLLPGRLDLSSLPRPGKRMFDIAVSALLLVLLLPVLLLVSAAVLLGDGGPVFYGQTRVGRNGRPFRIWKFRSMVVGADQQLDVHRDANMNSGLLFKLEDDPRVTPLGRVLRRFSIDELPQLVNVLVGDMSLVGPRPLPVDPADFAELAQKRHVVRPGITGPWQVAGGNALDYDAMVELDLAYISGASFTRDLDLLARTIPAVLFRRANY
jgi:lipopolysaccharide/colanic/teichoic acid biosynthesis glycosyltransferase